MKKFQDICGGTREASAVLSYLSGCGKAQYLSISKKELIEVYGFFVSLGFFKCDSQMRCLSKNESMILKGNELLFLNCEKIGVILKATDT